MSKNIIWTPNLSPIGGVETFIYSVARKYSDHDIMVLFRTADQKQLERLSRYVRTMQWNGQDRFSCEKLFMNLDTVIADYVDAKEYIRMIHADYKALDLRIPLHPKTTRYIAVSENSAKSFQEMAGILPEVYYNPIIITKPRRVLHLISTTRLSKEKGAERMDMLANALDDAGIPFTWTVYTNDDERNNLKNEHFLFAKPRLDVTDFIADADYLVQLSDCEGYPYSVLEAVCNRVPVITTPLSILEEIGLKDGENCIVLPFDMSEIPIQRIYKGLKRFNYEPRADNWDELLAPGESTYDPKADGLVAIKCVSAYFDTSMKRNVYPNQIIYVEQTRAKLILEAGFGIEYNNKTDTV